MNPDTNKFETIFPVVAKTKDGGPIITDLLRPDGSPIPKHWTIFSKDEKVVVKNYTFQVAHIGESYLVLEPIGPVVIGQK